ncbi:testis-specific Y-encoded protein 3-like [Dasypus novemcinctus]|uniref:testis-specific Y-encoded protein 3-like n=1 Tax=Dasypus novemcinctus TaxID=9361 RepID=UPI0039C9983F
MLSYMINLEVEEFSHPSKSCKMTFSFRSNPTLKMKPSLRFMTLPSLDTGNFTPLRSNGSTLLNTRPTTALTTAPTLSLLTCSLTTTLQNLIGLLRSSVRISG